MALWSLPSPGYKSAEEKISYPEFPEGAEVSDFLHHVLLKERMCEGILHCVPVLGLHHQKMGNLQAKAQPSITVGKLG